MCMGLVKRRAPLSLVYLLRRTGDGKSSSPLARRMQHDAVNLRWSVDP